MASMLEVWVTNALKTFEEEELDLGSLNSSSWLK
jgi:hypothetical protein